MASKPARKSAVALGYEPAEGSAPKVIAKGDGTLAEKILALAEENGVPIRRDQDLLQVLSRLDLNQEIPPQVYIAVAEILAFVYHSSQRYKDKVDAVRKRRQDEPGS